MARIRGTGNKDTELRLIALMRAAGIGGWRRGVRLRVTFRGPRLGVGMRASATKDRVATRHSSLITRRFLSIRPDFVFPQARLAVFVDGCFFHGCPQHATWPKHNAAFWRAKIEGNRARDRRQTRLLRANKWRGLRIWEHALTLHHASRTMTRLRRVLAKDPD